MAKMILKLEDLEGFELLQPGLISEDAEFNKWHTRANDIYLDFISQSGFEYRPYQPEFAAYLCLRRNHILNHQMGCGKTATTAVAIAALYDMSQPRPGRVHIVVPDVLIAQRWLEDLGRVPQLRDSYQFINDSRELLSAKKPILIYRFDFLRNKMPKPVRRRGYGSSISNRREDPQLRSTNNGNKLVADFLIQYLRPNMLVMDEAHNLSEKAERSQLIRKLRRKAKRCVALTGTLTDGSLKSVYTLCKFVYGTNFPFDSYDQMKASFAGGIKLATNYKSGSISNGTEKWIEGLDPSRLPEFFALIGRFVHRVKLSDPNISKYIKIPEENYQFHRVVPSAEMIHDYKEIIERQRAQGESIIRSTGVRANAAALRLLHPLINLSNVYNGTAIIPKLSELIDLISSAEGKVVVYCERVNAAEYVAHHLTTEGISTVQLHSGLSSDERVALLNLYNYNPDVKAGVFQIRLGSTGIDLPNTSDLFYYDLPWSILLIQQAAGRVIRPGNRNEKVNIHFLAHRGFVDEHKLATAETRTRSARLINDFEVLNLQEDERRVDDDFNALNILNSVLSGV